MGITARHTPGCAATAGESSSRGTSGVPRGIGWVRGCQHDRGTRVRRRDGDVDEGQARERASLAAPVTRVVGRHIEAVGRGRDDVAVAHHPEDDDGSMPYVVRSQMRFGFEGENRIAVGWGKTSAAAVEAESTRATAIGHATRVFIVPATASSPGAAVRARPRRK